MDHVKVKQLIDEGVAENPALFLVDYTISTDGEIEVLVDGDTGIDLTECIRISRHIESNLDRQEGDYSLVVSSPGLDKPLVIPRQYHKNIGRTLAVTLLNEEKIKGEIAVVTDEYFTVNWEEKQPKEVGKGKELVNKTKNIAYNEVLTAKVIITFNNQFKVEK